MSAFAPSPTKRDRRNSSAAEDLDPSDYKQLMAQGRKLLDTVRLVDMKQNVWNTELERCYKVEKRRNSNTNGDIASHAGAEDSDDVKSMTNPGFSKWLVRQNNIVSVSDNDLGNWFHLENLAMKTPFAAVVPCPSKLIDKGMRMMETAMSGFGFPMFYIQTVPINATLSDISRAFVVSPAHVPEKQRMSKSDLGPFCYVGTPCNSGTDAVDLITHTPALQDALHRTPVLLLNDYCPRVPICMRILVVAGKCVAAEVACDEAYTPLFGVLPNGDGSSREREQRAARRRERDGARRPSKPEEPVDTATDVLAFGLDNFVREGLGETLGSRSYEAIVLAEVKGFDPRVLGPSATSPPFWPYLGNESLASQPSPFDASGIRFYLVNIDEPNTKDFEVFVPEELRVISGYIHTHETQGSVGLPPVLRFLDGTAGNRHGEDDETVSTISIATELRASERAAERRRQRRRRVKKHADDAPSRRSSAAKENGDRPHRSSSGDLAEKPRDDRAREENKQGARSGDHTPERDQKPRHSEGRRSTTVSETSSTSSRLPSRLSSFNEGSSSRRHADPKKAHGASAIRKESIYTEERPDHLQPKQLAEQGRRLSSIAEADVESTRSSQSSRSSRLPERQSCAASHRSDAGPDTADAQSTRSSLPRRRGSQVGTISTRPTPEVPSPKVSSASQSGGSSATPCAPSSTSSAREHKDATSSVRSSNRPRVAEVETTTSQPIYPESSEAAPSVDASTMHESAMTESEKLFIDHHAEDKIAVEAISEGPVSNGRRSAATPSASKRGTSSRHSEPRSQISSSQSTESVGVDVECREPANGHGNDSENASSIHSSNRNIAIASQSSSKAESITTVDSVSSSSGAPRRPAVVRNSSDRMMSPAESSCYTSKLNEMAESSRLPSSQASSRSSKSSRSNYRRNGAGAAAVRGPAHERFEGGDNSLGIGAWSPSTSHVSSHRSTAASSVVNRRQREQQRPEGDAGVDAVKIVMADHHPNTSEPAQSPVHAAGSAGRSICMSPNSSAFRSAYSSRYTTPASHNIPGEVLDAIDEVNSATPSSAVGGAAEKSPDSQHSGYGDAADTADASSTATGSLLGDEAPASRCPGDDAAEHSTRDECVREWVHDSGEGSDDRHCDSDSETEEERDFLQSPTEPEDNASTQPGESSVGRGLGPQEGKGVVEVLADGNASQDAAAAKEEDPLHDADSSQGQRSDSELVDCFSSRHEGDEAEGAKELDDSTASSHAEVPDEAAQGDIRSHGGDSNLSNRADHTNENMSEHSADVVSDRVPHEGNTHDAATGALDEDTQNTAIEDHHEAGAEELTVPRNANRNVDDELRKARLMALSAVVTANAALDTILRASRKAENTY